MMSTGSHYISAVRPLADGRYTGTVLRIDARESVQAWQRRLARYGRQVGSFYAGKETARWRLKDALAELNRTQKTE